MAITLDFESNNPSSNLGRTLSFIPIEMTQKHPLVVLDPTQLINEAIEASKNGETGEISYYTVIMCMRFS